MINLIKLKQQWIDALRSGDYPQTQEALHDEDGYCCLGVLLDLIPKEELETLGYSWDGSDLLEYQIPIDNNGNYDVGNPKTKPTGTWENTGTQEFTVILCEDLNIDIRQHSALVQRNDSGDSFNEIADYIERSNDIIS